MEEILRFLADNPVQYLATAGLDGKPKVRPFQFMLEQGGKLYFCTGSHKEVYRELRQNPYVELCVSNPGNAWLRLSGKAVFTADPGIKNAMIEHSPLVKSIYQDGSNPVFEAFFLEKAKAAISDFSGNPPKEYVL